MRAPGIEPGKDLDPPRDAQAVPPIGLVHEIVREPGGLEQIVIDQDHLNSPSCLNVTRSGDASNRLICSRVLATRFAEIFACSSERSSPIDRLPMCFAAASVVPPPQNGSTIKSPRRE